MDAERLRIYLRSLPHVVETLKWGANLVFWIGDKAIGGRMFALINLDGEGRAAVSFSAGPELFAELLESDGLIPAPYMARIHWIAVERWNVFRAAEWEAHLLHAHQITLAKLPSKTRTVLALPVTRQKRLISDRRKLLAVRLAAR